jgi:anaerobic selenocysteine-containing dehydrogenase
MGRRWNVGPAFALLKELAAQYVPERSEAITWTPASDVRRAVRLFATEQPSCFFAWTGLEQHRDATQTNRAVDLFYALTGQIAQRGSNVLFATTSTNPVMGAKLLPQEQAARRLGLAERPLGSSAFPGLVPAYEVYHAILTGDPYPVKALVAFGGDLLLGRGDPLRGKTALEALEFYIHVDMFCNPSGL